MSDTPRTDAKRSGVNHFMGDWVNSNFAAELERELNAANDRIKRLEEAGNELRDCASRIGTVAAGEASVIRRTQEAIEEWNNKTK